MYHEEEVTLYDPQDVEFTQNAICSRERCAGALKNITAVDEEVDSILAEEGEIDMHRGLLRQSLPVHVMDTAEIRTTPLLPIHCRFINRLSADNIIA